jgi:hypothetical protein
MKATFLKVTFLFALLLCIGLKAIDISSMPQMPSIAQKLEQIVPKCPNKKTIVTSTNVLLVWGEIGNVSISKSDIKLLERIAKTDPKRFEEIISPKSNISSEEFASLIHQHNENIMIASTKERK